MSRNLLEYHPIVGYRYIPNLKARIRHEDGGYLVQSNNMGFRCRHDFKAENPHRKFRVLLFGDSFTAGDGVSNVYRFGDLLEQRFADMEVYNFGLPGSGTDQQYLAYTEFAPGIAHDLLVICPYSDNIRRNVASHRLAKSGVKEEFVFRPKPYYELREGEIHLNHCPTPKETIRLADVDLKKVPAAWLPDGWQPEGDAIDDKFSFFELAKRILSGLDERYPGLRCRSQRLRGVRWPVQYENAEHPDWLLMQAIISKWIKSSTSDTLLFPMPNFRHIEGCCNAENFRRRFSELANSTGSKFVDCLPKFWSLPFYERRVARFPTDDHPNKSGHTIISEVLIDAITPAYDRWKEAKK